MTGMGKPTGDQQTWVYRTGTDSWQAGSTGGGSGGSVASGFQQANYTFVTSSNQWAVPAGSTFVGEPVLTASITTTGSPVFITVNANYTAQSGTPTGIFSLARNGVNLGHPVWGMKPSGPLQNSFNDNVSIQFVDFPPAGTYSYSFIGCNPTGSGFLTAYGAGPASILAFEMKGANVVTASSMTEVSVPGGNVTGLSASITPTKGPVLAIASLTHAGDNAVNWAHGTIARNGTNLGGGTDEVLTVNTVAGEANCFNMMFLDQGATIGGSNTYNVQATQGAGTGKINKNNSLGTLILWELPDVNFKYATSTATTGLGGSYTDVVPSTPSLLIQTRGRPVLVGWAGQINTTSTTGRSGWSFLRNGSAIATSSKGFQIVDGEGNNDWNRVPSMFWLDQVSAGSYQYQVAGFNISGSQSMNQSPAGIDALFIYELDPGPGILAGGWLDTGNKLSTTSSVSISDGTENITNPQAKGQDVYLYVSGTIGVSTASNPQNARVALFGGDVRVSGSLTVGSGSVTVTSNDVQFGGGARIERQGNDLKFIDVNNPAGKTLSNIGSGGSTSTSTTVVTASNDWVTIFDVDCTTQPSVTFTADSTSNSLFGYSWITENMANVDSIAIVPGVGLVFDPNANSSDQFTSTNTAPSLILPMSRALPDYRQEDYELRLWAICEITGSDANFEVTRGGFARYPFSNGGSTMFFNAWARGYSNGNFFSHDNFYNGSQTGQGSTLGTTTNAVCIHQKALTESDFFVAITAPSASFPVNPTAAAGFKLSSFQRYQGNVFISTVTGSADLAVHLNAFTVNTTNSFQATYKRLKLEYRKRTFTFTGSLSVNGVPAVNGYLARYTPVDGNVIHQWRLNEPAGSTSFADAVSGSGNAMTLDNSGTPATPILVGRTSLFDGAIRNFNNTNNLYSPNVISTPPSASFTLDCWVQYNTGGNAYIFGRQWKDPQDGTNFSTIALAASGIGSLGYWMTTAGGSETGAYAKYTFSAATQDTWHHVGLTYDGANVRLYVDGEFVFSEARTGNADFQFSAPWFVSNFKLPAASRPFSGKVMDCRVHNIVRPESYFRSIYNLGIGLASGSTSATTAGVTSGSFAARPTPALAGRVYLPTDSLGTGFVDNGVAWQPFGPTWILTRPPASASWTNVTLGSTVAFTDENDALFLSASAGSSPDFKIAARAAPATPYKITALLCPMPGIGVNSSVVTIGWRESSSGKIAPFGVYISATANRIYYAKYNTPTSFNAVYFDVPGYLGQFIWLRLEDDGTNRRVGYSMDGKHFMFPQSTSRTDFLTPDQVFIAVDPETVASAMTVLSWKVE